MEKQKREREREGSHRGGKEPVIWKREGPVKRVATGHFKHSDASSSIFQSVCVSRP